MRLYLGRGKLNLQTLALFCLIVEKGSFSKAAKLNFISQPAVTKQIKQLEAHYNTQLFDRDKRGSVTLTETGKILYTYAKEIISTYNQSQKAIDSILNEKEYTINIGATFTIGEFLLPKILGEFQKGNKIQFSLSIGNTPKIISELLDNEIDIAFVEGIVKNNDLEKERFAEDELIIVVPYKHPWCNRQEIEITELSEEKMIWREQDAGIRRIIENLLTQYDLLKDIKSTMELGSIQAIKSAVESGLGIAILPELSVLKEIELNKMKKIRISKMKIKRDLWILRKRKKTILSNQNIGQLINFIKNYMV